MQFKLKSYWVEYTYAHKHTYTHTNTYIHNYTYTHIKATKNKDKT